MKKILLLIFIMSFSSQAQKNLKIDNDNIYVFNNDLEFSIFKISKNRTTSRYNTTYVAKKGTRFVSMYLKFKNNSNETKTIDFSNILLLTDNNQTIKIDFVVKAMKLTANTDKLKIKLKPGKKRMIAIEFESPVEKDEKIDQLLINEKVVPISYN